MKRKARVTALALLVAILCGGCAYAGGDRLYALPRMTDEYIQLEELIAQQIQDGGEYASPVGGSNRQSIQLRDLDGDGADEAIAFLADENHTPNVCVYRCGEDGNYYLFVSIEGAGSAVSSVEYADLNGDGGQEMIISWQIGGELRLLTVYLLGGEVQTQLLSEDSSGFVVCDLDEDGRDELLNLCMDSGSAGVLTRYVFDEDGQTASSEARISEGIENVLRLRTGYLSDGVRALFAESRWGDDELITDVFIAGKDGLENITISGRRSNTLRQDEAYAADINADRAMEIPESGGDVLTWYALDSAGRKTAVLSSYHDFEEGWYLILPESMLTGSLNVSRREDVSGENKVTFSVGGTPLLAIYTLTGDNRLDRAGAEGRFVLMQDGATVYAGEILSGELTEEEIQFNLIYPEWQTGELG